MVKMSIPKAINRFNISPINIPMMVYVKIYPKIEYQGALNSQNNYEKEEYNWRAHTFEFKTYYKTTVVKTV